MDTIKIMNMLLVQLKCIERSIEEIREYYTKNKLEITEPHEPGLSLEKYLFALVNLKLTIERIQKTNVDSLSEENKKIFYEEKEESEYILSELSASKLLYSVYNNIIISEIEGEQKIDFKSEAILLYFRQKVDDIELNKGIMDRSYEMQTVLINLCRAFENFSSEILRAHYLDNTKQKDLLEKPILYKDLLDFSSIDEVKDFLVDDYLDKLFHGSFIAWYAKISAVLNMDGLYSKEISMINEAFQRRNLYVHANGKVNNHYLKNVSKEQAAKVNIGEFIETDLDYLNNVFAMIEDLCWWMFYKLTLQKGNGYEECFKEINDILLQNLKRNRNSIAVIYEDMIMKGKLQIRNLKICEVNYFLFFRTNNRIEEVTDKLNRFDVDGCANEFKLCKDILQGGDGLDDKAIAFFEMLDDVDFIYDFEWPVLAYVRHEPKVESYFEQRLNKCLEI